MKNNILKIVPKTLKDFVKNTKQFQNYQADKYPYFLATTSKRLDICSAQFAHMLHTSNYPSLIGKICLEIGSGYVLSHALICHLLGAKKVIATDVFPHANTEALSEAVQASITSIIRDILSPFEQHTLLRSRLDYLRTIKHFDFNVLKELGIEYIAPIDLAKEKLKTPVDFIFSNSVLEHIPRDDVTLVLENIFEILKPNGAMIHCIHMEDHKDIPHNPFEFLKIPSESYSRSMETDRGNRIRKSEWLKVFAQLSGATSKTIYEWDRIEKKLPVNIDKSIHFNDESDLQVSHIGMLTIKN